MTTPVTGFAEMFPTLTVTTPSSPSAPAQGAQDISSDFLSALLGNLLAAEGNLDSEAELDPKADVPDARQVSAFQLALPGLQAPEPAESELDDTSKDPQLDLLAAVAFQPDLQNLVEAARGGDAPVTSLAPHGVSLPSFENAGISAEDLTEPADIASNVQPPVHSMRRDTPVNSAQFDWVRNQFPAAVDKARPVEDGAGDAKDVATQFVEAAEDGLERFALRASVGENRLPMATPPQQGSDPQRAIADFSEILNPVPKSEDLAPKTAIAIPKSEDLASKTAIAAESPTEQPEAAVKPVVSTDRQAKEIPVELLSRPAGAGTRKAGQPEVEAVSHALESPISVPGGKELPAQKSAPAVSPKQQDFLFQLADRIRVQVQNGGSEIRVQLRPESLGRLEITAETGAQGVVARIVAETAGVKQFLEGNLPVLQQSLQDSGLKIDRIEFILHDGLDARLSSGDQQQTDAGRHAPEPGNYFGRMNRRDEITLDSPALVAVGPNSTFHTVA